MSSPESSENVEYLLLGHVSRDLSPEGPRLGGAVAYSGLTARALGMSVGVVTAAGTDIALGPLAGLQLHCLPSAQTTTFKNVYVEGTRRQQVIATASPLSPSDVPPGWLGAACVHLAPIADELPLDAGRAFPSARLFCTPQGWLRRWDTEGHVSPHAWQRLLPTLHGIQAAVLGWEDIDHDIEAARTLAGIVPILVLTAGPSGADLFCEGESAHLDAPQAHQVDPTGAGDVFAAAFFVGLLRRDSPLAAARRAATIAARSVEAVGLDGVPSASQLAAFEATAP
jgi:sugar/nucleoside kinase (ribokinase family)